ncbi:MAG TPA: polyprenyl synthetase family protein [Verrucomicrobiota bacterium]|nr:polyprenyl synthetase family protein [Verrucomicrobiota bacterium]OQC62947.1 MAG: Heptaprenyl diphosphate synthase component 2 [Verrucomicrobia bacterium ADurb.Bin006]HNU98314.1 polyprenyl synthetase family protein [Verrucomicrobiota bacterium]HOA59971.1 polyprenyl synthetase family protein [Verrucomicrobiota bacterium]HOF47532.1 polyprenyl synthetase family protein [Verrucomicrobiota bacterium]
MAEPSPRPAAVSTPDRRLARPAQRVPKDKAMRELLRAAARDHVARHRLVPPLTLEELRAHTRAVIESLGQDPAYSDFTTVLIGNETWRETLAGIPFDRRVVLLPQCLRTRGDCAAEMDEFGLLCEQCGRCLIGEFQAEAQGLGCVTLVAEGTTVVTRLLEQGRVDAVIGVSCLHVLERAFPHAAMHAIPGIAIPLFRDGCDATGVDADWVREAIRLKSEVVWPGRLDIDALRREVERWFQIDELQSVLGCAGTFTELKAHEWLAQAGKRWRPLLTVCVHNTLAGLADTDSLPDSVRKVAMATECFHKASLLHDDIEDGDEFRYGAPTLARQHGMPIALNLGDYLIGEGYRLLADSGLTPLQRVRAFKIAAEGHRSLCLGQGAELDWMRSASPLTTAQTLDLFRCKTAPAFEVALRLGAVCADADEAIEEPLRRFSAALGIAYQIRDDLDDAFDPQAPGDAAARRPSILVSIACEQASGDARARLQLAFGTEASAATRREIFRDVFLMLRTEDKARQLLEHYRNEAQRSLSPLQNAHLKGLLRRLVGRLLGPPPTAPAKA